jgi:hypothetical protein
MAVILSPGEFHASPRRLKKPTDPKNPNNQQMVSWAPPRMKYPPQTR